MNANQDKTTKMTQEAKPDQQPNISHGNSVHGTMKPVAAKKAASMNLKKGGDHHRGNI